ncbi:MAG TPA: FAD-binding oxidoreductase, partial [Aquella sp.]|nr:FAD-binding oxidoreductase [Aquella sp.]
MNTSTNNNSAAKKFIKQLSQFIDRSRITDDQLLCYAYGTDASMYRMTPKLVVFVENATEVQKLLALAQGNNLSLTFRAAGTSLSGQAITNSVLVVLSNNFWQNYTIHKNGQQISLEPGIIGAQANLFLKPYNTKIGPDPASINSCKIGGIVANNSSGMCCGVAQNTYKTMSSIKLILANGSTLDTANIDSKNKFTQANPQLIDGIKNIYQQIHNDAELLELITNKFKIKNTSGYSLNAFIDYHDPLDILAHLMVGSEGTLGFISEITYNCVADNQHKAVSLIYCDNLEQIIDLSLALKNIVVDAIELLDITSIIAVKSVVKNAKYLPQELTHDTSAILIEISANSEAELNENIQQVQLIIDQHPVMHQIEFTSDNKISEELWDI